MEGWEIVAAYSAPDRPAGRGRLLQPSPVKAHAETLGIPVLTPPRLKPPEEVERFRALKADLVVLAAYGLLLPAPYLFEPRHRAVNVHPSLLPRHRGASPVAGAILAGDEVTGTSIMVMDEGMDTGAVLAQREVVLDGTERTPVLTDELFALGAEMLRELLPAYVRGEAVPHPQREEGVTVVRRFKKEDGALDWTKPAVQLERQVRAFDPWPGSATVWDGKRLEVLEAIAVAGTGASPGTVVQIESAVGVATGDGTLVLMRVKPEGRGEMDATAFSRGREGFVGARLPS